MLPQSQYQERGPLATVGIGELERRTEFLAWTCSLPMLKIGPNKPTKLHPEAGTCFPLPGARTSNICADECAQYDALFHNNYANCGS